AARDRITEIGIVRVDADGGVPRVTEWSALANPGLSVPAAMVALTGISEAMIADAPSFASLARDVTQLLGGCVFVAHNARFDYGFLKHEFARLERSFTARVLCTVKLSRRMFPDVQGHNLDALIERHHLLGTDRHRALGDARAIWEFMQTLYRDFHAEAVEIAVKQALRIASLPPQLPEDTLDTLPETAVLMLGNAGAPMFVRAQGIEPSALAGSFGPFSSRSVARETLRGLAAEHRLCWRRLGLDRRRAGPCFRRQLKCCAGFCVGEE